MRRHRCGVLCTLVSVPIGDSVNEGPVEGNTRSPAPSDERSSFRDPESPVAGPGGLPHQAGGDTATAAPEEALVGINEDQLDLGQLRPIVITRTVVGLNGEPVDVVIDVPMPGGWEGPPAQPRLSVVADAPAITKPAPKSTRSLLGEAFLEVGTTLVPSPSVSPTVTSALRCCGTLITSWRRRHCAARAPLFKSALNPPELI